VESEAVPNTKLAAGDPVGPRERWLISGLTAIAFVVCLYRIGQADLWLDEAFSLAGSGDLARSWSDRGGSMGLYYSLLAVWAEPASSTTWVRLPSAAFAAATVPFAYLIARAVGGVRVAVTSAALLVVSWAFVRYGQEARSYSMTMFLATASWWLFIRNMTGPTAPARLLAQGAVTAMVGYAQPLGLLAVAPQWALVALAPRPWGTIRRLAPAAVTAGVLLVPLVGLIVRAPDAGPSWVQPLNLRQLRQLHTQLGGSMPVSAWLLTAAIVAGLIVATTRAVRERDRRWLAATPAVWFLLPIVGLVVLSLVEPYFVARYLVPITPAAAILAAMALARLPARAATAGAVVLVALMASSTARLYTHPREDWSGVVTFVADHDATDHQAVVHFADPELRIPFEHAHLVGGDPDAVRPLLSPDQWGRLPRYLPDQGLDDATDRVATLDALWIVDRGHDEDGDPVAGRVAAKLEHPVLAGWCPRTSGWFAGGLVAVELVPGPTCDGPGPRG
jgi:hypothetical protein